MTDAEVIILVDRISRSNPIEIQQEAMRTLCNIEPGQAHLLLDEWKKPTWENAVKILKQIGYPANRGAISGMMMLLQDVNWPGSEEAIHLLASMEKFIWLPIAEQSIITANEAGDTMWLGGIRRLIESAGVTKNDFDNRAAYDLLQYADF